MTENTKMTRVEADRVLDEVPEWLGYQCDIEDELHIAESNMSLARDSRRDDRKFLRSEALVSVITAQVHATQHLAEQRRIANLLELCRMVSPEDPLVPLRNAEVLLGFVENEASLLFNEDLTDLLRLNRGHLERREAALDALALGKRPCGPEFSDGSPARDFDEV